jgi:phenylacetate-CoA ligase
MDEMSVQCELTHQAAAALSAERRTEVARRAGEALKRELNVRIPVELLEPETLPPTVFKARRVVDRRTEAATT